MSKSLESLEAERPVKDQVKLRRRFRVSTSFLTGLATTGFGFYMFFASGAIGLLLLLVGVVILMHAFRIDGSTFGTPGQGRASGKSLGLGGKNATLRREIGKDPNVLVSEQEKDRESIR